MTVSNKNQATAHIVSRSFASSSGKELSIILQGEHQLYDAKLLHKDLQVKVKYEDWIKRRISDFKFESGIDFFANLRKSTGGRPATEYLLTLDMCKELGMLERSEIGRMIRKRFIAKEKELRGVSRLPHQPELFRGLKMQNINGRKMYPYQAIRERCGYSTRSSSAGHRHRYAGHFVLNGRTLLVTAEFSLHLYRQRQVMNNRIALREMQPVLPFNFGDASTLNLGSHGKH